MALALLWASMACIALFVPRGDAGHNYFHNYPHDSNFTTERAQYALERAVLKDFYFKTNPGLFGSHNTRDWTSAQMWLSKDVTHCLWEGITCTVNGSVTRIFLPDNNLHGNIPRSITKLPELKHLWLFGNNLGPFIPNYLGDITKLEYLFLQNNRYEGDVQPALAKLRHLKVLDLSGMQLGERLVRDNDTESYVKARNLSYGQIELTGIPANYGAPAGSTVGGVQTPSYPAFESLIDLDLSYNLLHGTIPSTLSKLPRLQRLYLSSNRLNGTIPEGFANATSLKTLTFDLNVGICSDTTKPHPPEHVGILAGTVLPETCPFSQGPPNARQDDMPFRGDEVKLHDPNNHRHPLDRGVTNWTYCGPLAKPDPVPCVYESIVPLAVRNRTDLNITWKYPPTGTLAIRDGKASIDEQTRYERREHREGSYPFNWWNVSIATEQHASRAGLDGILNMWNDNQRPHGFKIT